MNVDRPTLFDSVKTSSVRRSDPVSSRDAATCDDEGRTIQKHRILRYLHEHGEITADEAFRLLPEDGEDTERADWSARLGVLKHDGLVENAGWRDEEGRKGRVRRVLKYRLTTDGIRTCAVMFDGARA